MLILAVPMKNIHTKNEMAIRFMIHKAYNDLEWASRQKRENSRFFPLFLAIYIRHVWPTSGNDQLNIIEL